jgi:hypothetical protein
MVGKVDYSVVVLMRPEQGYVSLVGFLFLSLFSIFSSSRLSLTFVEDGRLHRRRAPPGRGRGASGGAGRTPGRRAGQGEPRREGRPVRGHAGRTSGAPQGSPGGLHKGKREGREELTTGLDGRQQPLTGDPNKSMERGWERGGRGRGWLLSS